MMKDFRNYLYSKPSQGDVHWALLQPSKTASSRGPAQSSVENVPDVNTLVLIELHHDCIQRDGEINTNTSVHTWIIAVIHK